ncbi:hypothetical protein ACSBR1_013309 [Camellia fascicularis]
MVTLYKMATYIQVQESCQLQTDHRLHGVYLRKWTEVSMSFDCKMNSITPFAGANALILWKWACALQVLFDLEFVENENAREKN